MIIVGTYMDMYVKNYLYCSMCLLLFIFYLNVNVKRVIWFE